ncbi:MAG TPA: VWA domain-containing protein [Thermoanaerobaculia bacterium]|nr:VWA domain-containing protein [Thermoanaerobaculia bacterium]
MRNAPAPALALLILLTHGVTYAQFSETVEVRVTNVDVIVTDKAGKPVPGLTKDDFEIYENGTRQEITNFAEIGESVPSGTLTALPGETPAEEPAARDIRRRLISVFIDNASLEVGHRAAVLEHLQQFLAKNVRPGDGIAIYAWGLGLEVQLEPTSDPDQIAAAIDKLAEHTTVSHSWRQQFYNTIDSIIASAKNSYPPRTPDFGEALAAAETAARNSTHDMRRKTAAIKSVIASLRGIEGRKVLVMLTESLSTNPAEEAFHHLETIRHEFVGAQHFNPFSAARPHMLQNLSGEIARAANTAGVTIYPIHAAGKWADSTFTDASVGVTVRGAPTVHTDTSTQTLHAVAEDTGGRAAVGSSDFQFAFDAISNDLNVYYSLGYRTSGERKDRLKKVEVKLKKKGYVVRSRNAIIEQTATTEMNDMVAANLFQAGSTNDLNIQARILGTATPAGENLVHPLTIVIPTSTLTLIPDGTDVIGKFSVFTAFLRGDGAVSAVGRQTQEFRWPAESLARRKQVTVKLDVTADSRVSAISVGVMDDASSATGFALVKLATATDDTQGSTE